PPDVGRFEGKLLAVVLMPSLTGFAILTWTAATWLRVEVESDYHDYGKAIARAVAVGASEQLTSLAGNPGQEEASADISTLQGYVDYDKSLPGVCYLFIEQGDGSVIHS